MEKNEPKADNFKATLETVTEKRGEKSNLRQTRNVALSSYKHTG